MQKTLKNLTIISTLAILSACGGGGGDADSSPTITLSSSNIDLNERSSTTINVTTSAAENNTVTVTASSDNGVLTASYANGVLTLTASEVALNTAITVTLVAIDSKSASSTKTLTVNVKDLPNQAPELSWVGEQQHIDLNERSLTTIDVTTSDAENDTVTVTASSDNEVLTASYADGVLTLTASEVALNMAITVTVEAIDSKSASSTKILTINVKDLPNLAPELSWIGEQPRKQMSERTQLSIPFDVTDTDTDLSELIFDVTFDLVDGYQEEDNMPTFEVDLENKLLILTAKISDDTTSELLGEFSVFDGETKKSINLNIHLSVNRALTYLRFNKLNIVEGGSSIDTVYDIVAGDSDKFIIGDVYFDDNADKEENLLSWSLDKDNRTLTVHADVGAIGKDIALKVQYTDKDMFNDDGERLYNSSTVNFHIKEVMTQNEIDLMAKFEAFKRNIELSAEYEGVSDFLLDYLLINQKISKEEYNDIQDNAYHFRSTYPTIVNRHERTIKDKILTTNFYADPANSQPVIDDFNNMIAQAETTYAREIVDFINDSILNRVDGISVLLPRIDFTDSYSYTNGELVSRLVGKDEFGVYVDDQWVFNDTYSFLRASSAITLNDSRL